MNASDPIVQAANLLLGACALGAFYLARPTRYNPFWTSEHGEAKCALLVALGTIAILGIVAK